MPQHRTVIGLDIGAHSAKLVRADRRGKGFELTRAETIRLPPDTAKTAGVILKWLSELGLSKYPFVLGLTGRNVMFQTIAIADEDPRSYDQVAALEIAKINELSAEDTVYDYLPIELRSEQKRVLIGMARPSVLEEVLTLRSALKIHIVDIAPTPSALLTAAREYGAFASEVGPTGGLQVCIDIGDGGTDVAVGKHQSFLFARSFAVGGGLLTQALLDQDNASVRQAEHAKETQPILREGTDAQRAALGRALGVWVSELKATLAAFHSVYPEEWPTPTRLVLSGGGSDLPGLSEHLARELGTQVTRISELPNRPQHGQEGRYAVAAGLAIQGMLAGSGSLSLLPAAMRDEIVLRRQKRYWIAAGITAALILTISVLGGYRDFRHMTAQLGAQRESLRRCQELAAQIDQSKARNAQIVAMAEPVRTMLGNGGIIGRLLDVVSEARGPNDWITMISDADSYFAGAAVFKRGLPIPPAPVRVTDPSGQPPPPPPGTYSAFGRVMIEIYTQRQDPATVKTLIWALRSKPFVLSADLLADDQLVQDPERDERWGKPASRRFVIDVRTKQP